MYDALLKHKQDHHTQQGRKVIMQRKKEKQERHYELLREHARLKAEKARLKAEREFPREAMLLIFLAENETNQTPIATLTDDVLQCVFQHLC